MTLMTHCAAENDLGAEGATAIAGVLQVNSRIMMVDLWSERGGGRAHIICGCRFNKSRPAPDNQIGPSGAAAIAKALKMNTAGATVKFGSE